MLDAYVFGDDLGALSAALELAEVGLRVRIGATGSVLPTGPVRDETGAIADLCERLAAPVTDGGTPHDAVAPVRVPPERTAIRGPGGEWRAMPEPSVLGIPAVPLSSESIALLGRGPAFRAYLDRLKPVLTIGKTQWFDALVNTRIGAKARRRLVDPVVRERFGCELSEVEVSIAAPGLNETMSRTGSLTGAVLAYAERNVARETRVEPREGWTALRAVLLERLALYSVQIDTGVQSDAGVQPDAGWITDVVRIAQADSETFRLSLSDGSIIESRSIIVPTSMNAGRDEGNVALYEAIGLNDLLPRAQRAYAAIDIQRPEWADDVRMTTAGSALLSEDSDSGAEGAAAGNPWSIRVTIPEDIGTAPRAELRSSVMESAAEPPSTETLIALLERVGVQPDPDAGWTVRTLAAPYATHEARERAEAARDAFEGSDPFVLPVGSDLIGGDLSSSLDRARDRAVTLRRRLLGLVDE